MLQRCLLLPYRIILSSLYILLFLFTIVEVYFDSDLSKSNESNDIEHYTNATDNRVVDIYINGKVYTYPKAHTPKTIPKDLKYILIWNPHDNPFHLLTEGKKSFVLNDCPHTNCFITYEKDYFKNKQQDFDAILFSGCALRGIRESELPSNRLLKQKYVFACLESAPFHPVTDPMFDGFFNWTWTFRFDSNISWKYIAIYDLNDKLVGPNENMKWIKKMKPIDEDFKKRLRRKTKAAAWFVSNCRTHSEREKFKTRLEEELKVYGLSIDVYGACGKSGCSRTISCYKMLERTYFFYFAFENSFDEDYVTEKLLIALKNSVVPIVYGGADYTRFLPPGSYLDARELGPKKLAKIINNSIRNVNVYYKFFKWRNHYKYKASEDTSEICNLCAALNNEKMMHETSIYKKFRLWWNGSLRQKTYDFVLNNILSNSKLLNLASAYNFTREGSLVMIKSIKRQSKDQIKRSYLNYIKNSTIWNVLDPLVGFDGNDSSNSSIPTYAFNFTTTDSSNNESVSGTTADYLSLIVY